MSLRPATVPRGTLVAVAGGVITSGLGVLAWGEWVHARADRPSARLPMPSAGSHCSVIVLGFANRGTRANAVNRWRARVAVRTARRLERAGASVTIVFSGGAVRGCVAEAVLLHRYIVGPLGWSGTSKIEPESSSTWENVRLTLPLLDAGDWIAFASNGLHASKAAIYLSRHSPDMASRLLAADDYRFGEMILAKPVFAAVGLRKRRAAFHVEHGRMRS